MILLQTDGLIIDWTSMPTYNTIMAVATGAALCSMAVIGKQLHKREHIQPEGWALNLGVLGILLFLTGLHMTLTWPLAAYFPFDNIVFGEPTLALGAIVLALSFYFWRRSETIISSDAPLQAVAKVLQHFKFILYGLGLALIATGIAGVRYKLFAAPPEEPIAGEFAAYPIIEAIFISSLWAFTGVACLLLPGIMKRLSSGIPVAGIEKLWGRLLYGLGIVFLIFGAMNYFTHIGLIVNTME